MGPPCSKSFGLTAGNGEFSRTSKSKLWSAWSAWSASTEAGIKSKRADGDVGMKRCGHVNHLVEHRSTNVTNCNTP